jgi:hypothetical protein
MKINKITIRGEKQPNQLAFDATDDLKLDDVYLIGSTTRGEIERHTITPFGTAPTKPSRMYFPKPPW